MRLGVWMRTRITNIPFIYPKALRPTKPPPLHLGMVILYCAKQIETCVSLFRCPVSNEMFTKAQQIYTQGDVRSDRETG
jgi:hypothetical protein